MDDKILSILSAVTDEEEQILHGRTAIDRSLYMDGSSDMITGRKMLSHGKQLKVRPHTRFIHFPEHTHDYVEMVYMCRGSTRHIINVTEVELCTGELLILGQNWNESELENDDLKNYKMKAEFYVRQNQDNAVIAKLKTNQPLTSDDVKELERILWGEHGTKRDYENEYGSKPLGEFVREIVGLDMNAAKEAFAEYLTDTSLDSRQIYFVNQIVEYIVHNGLMKDMSVLLDASFTDNGSIVEVFTDMSVWLGIKRIIDRINANAIAA